MTDSFNIADRLRESAYRSPWQRAVVYPQGRDSRGRVRYTHLTFEQLESLADRIARGLIRLGVQPGMKLVLMARPSPDFIALTFGVFRAGAVCVLIDPGMGRSNVLRCLARIDPDGFVAIPIVQLIRVLNRSRFPRARFNVTLGRALPGTGTTLDALLAGADDGAVLPRTLSTDMAAIIFTSGSTGPPKGVVYEHGMFDAQVELLRDCYEIQPGEIDLPGFPLFALFNSAMRVTTIIPDMDPTRPAQVDPARILEAIDDHGVTLAFGSPAIWNRIGSYCERTGIELRSIRRILSAGAPVPNHVLQQISGILSDVSADIFTPYGATECLPVASIGGREVLRETAELTSQGAGTCVGRLFPGVEVRIIEITDQPLATINDACELPTGKTGEIIVRSRAATREYYCEPQATARAKIADGESLWHRMGDVGYFDGNGRLWFCGRKSQIVKTATGRLFTVRCEAILNNHPRVSRCALVGIGSGPVQRPVIVIEPRCGSFPATSADQTRFRSELVQLGLGSDLTRTIDTFLFHRSLPVDVRHNVKILREKLAVWAERNLNRT